MEGYASSEIRNLLSNPENIKVRVSDNKILMMFVLSSHIRTKKYFDRHKVKFELMNNILKKDFTDTDYPSVLDDVKHKDVVTMAISNIKLIFDATQDLYLKIVIKQE